MLCKIFSAFFMSYAQSILRHIYRGFKMLQKYSPGNVRVLGQDNFCGFMFARLFETEI